MIGLNFYYLPSGRLIPSKQDNQVDRSSSASFVACRHLTTVVVRHIVTICIGVHNLTKVKCCGRHVQLCKRAYKYTYIRPYANNYVLMQINMHLCILIRHCTHIYMQLYIHTLVLMQTYMYLCIHTFTYAYILVLMHTYEYLCIHTCTYAYIRVLMYTYVYLCIQICAYTYIHVFKHAYV